MLLISVSSWVDPHGHSAAGRIMSMKISSDTIGKRTRYLPSRSAVSQTPHAHNYLELFQQHYLIRCVWMLTEYTQITARCKYRNLRISEQIWCIHLCPTSFLSTFLKHRTNSSHRATTGHRSFKSHTSGIHLEAIQCSWYGLRNSAHTFPLQKYMLQEVASTTIIKRLVL